MSDSHDAGRDAHEGDAFDSTIERYLVRHGALGRRRLVGSIRPLRLARGDRLLVRTERGVEAAEVLLGPTELPQSLADRPPAGEAIEGLSSQAGHLSEQALSAENAAERALAEERVRRLVELRAPETVIVDVETLWEGRDLIFYLAFEGSHELGRIAVEASTPTLRVRFESHDPPEDVSVERFDQRDGGEESAKARNQRDVDRRPREERLKETPDPLVGDLPRILAMPERKIGYEHAFRLQHHGLYVQRRREPAEPSRSAPGASQQEAMLRVRLPGGRLSTAQFLAIAEIADRYGRGELRLTTRQTIQVHGLAIGALAEVQQALEAAGVSSWATCGDTVRNVVACPALPRRASWGSAMRRATLTLDRLLQPERSPYERLWHDVAPAAAHATPDDPLFGKTLLPRKFKVAVAAPGNCCTDLLTNDLGFEATLAGETLAGWNVYIGGGLGYSLGRDDTAPRLAEPLGWIGAEKVFDVAQATLGWFRREGDRTDRRRARLKYLVADLGIDVAREAIERKANVRFEPRRSSTVEKDKTARSPDDHLDRAIQDDSRIRRGLHLPTGRLGGERGGDLKSLCETLRALRPALAITPQQNLLFLDLDPTQEAKLFAALREGGFDVEPADALRRNALACPALPTCGLALAEGERLLPEVVAKLRTALDEAGLIGEALDLSVTGCPNGCARSYLAELALVGVGRGRYALRVGGTRQRDRLNVEVGTVSTDRLDEAFRTLARWWAERREEGEAFGGTVLWRGTEELRERWSSLGESLPPEEVGDAPADADED